MKKLLVSIAIFLGIIAALAIVAPHFINAEAIKKPIVEKIQAMTGRTLAINGPIKLSFLPSVHVSLQDVTLRDPKEKEEFISLKSLEAGMALIPLLNNDFQIDSIILQSPVIRLRVAKDGTNNWSLPENRKADSPSKTPNDPRRNLSSTSIHLAQLKIEDGTIIYNNEAAQRQAELKNVTALVTMKGIDAPASLNLKAKLNDKDVSLKTNLDSLENLTTTSTKTSFAISGGSLEVSGNGIAGLQGYVGPLNVKIGSLQEINDWLQLKSDLTGLPNPLAISLQGNVECKLPQCNISKANIAFDKIQAKGNIKTSWSKQTPQIDIDAETNLINLNPYLAPATSAVSTLIGDAVAEAPRWSNEPVDFSLLQKFNSSFNIKTTGILYKKLTVGQSILRGKLQDGTLNSSLIDAVVYGGKANVTFNVIGNSHPSLDARVAMSQVNVGPLLSNSMDLNRLDGKGTVILNVSSYGKSEKEIISNLGGNGQVKITDGHIKGINLTDMVHNLQTAFVKGGDGNQQTPFSELSGSFTIANGIISNQDLNMGLPVMRLSGNGTINLPAYSINYRLTPQLIRNANNTQQEGLGVPLVVAGSLDNPQFRPDVGNVVQEAIKDPKKFKEQLKNSENSIKDQLKDPKATVKNIKGLLKGF